MNSFLRAVVATVLCIAYSVGYVESERVSFGMKIIFLPLHG